MPASKAAFKMGIERSASKTQPFHLEEPIDIVPKQKRDTFKPVRPNRTFSISFLREIGCKGSHRKSKQSGVANTK